MLDEPTLRATATLDFHDPRVEAFVSRVVAGATGDRARAVALFRAVRDEIRYDPYTAATTALAIRASRTLERGRAYCVPKAILFAAGLRRLGIPSRLGFADVTNHLATPRLLEHLRTSVFSFHGWTEALLDGRWVKATPAFDAATCARFGVPPLEWDGASDAMLQAFDGQGKRFMEYLVDRGVHDDTPLDEMIRVWTEIYPHLVHEWNTQT